MCSTAVAAPVLAVAAPGLYLRVRGQGFARWGLRDLSCYFVKRETLRVRGQGFARWGLRDLSCYFVKREPLHVDTVQYIEWARFPMSLRLSLLDVLV
jgi:hypothetical protein